MSIRTIEDSFEYQMAQVFKKLRADYEEVQKDNKTAGFAIDTFAEWIRKNPDEVGEEIIQRYDEYAGLEESVSLADCHKENLLR